MEEQHPDHLQPGQVISPRGTEPAAAPAAQSSPDSVTPPAPVVTPPPSADSAAPLPAAEPVAPPADPASQWDYREGATAGLAPTPEVPEQLNWTASEFLSHDKGARWYAVLAAAGVLGAVVDYLGTKDIFSTVVILFTALIFGVYAARQPREQHYGLDYQGVSVGARLYGFQGFKSFSVVDEGAAATVVFMPLKRFMPPLIIFVTPEVEEQVVAFLASLLPMERHRPDAIDSLMRRIRF